MEGRRTGRKSEVRTTEETVWRIDGWMLHAMVDETIDVEIDVKMDVKMDAKIDMKMNEIIVVNMSVRSTNVTCVTVAGKVAKIGT